MLKVLDFEPGPQTQSSDHYDETEVAPEVEPEINVAQVVLRPFLKCFGECLQVDHGSCGSRDRRDSHRDDKEGKDRFGYLSFLE